MCIIVLIWVFCAKWHIKLPELFNAKAISLEEQYRCLFNQQLGELRSLYVSEGH